MFVWNERRCDLWSGLLMLLTTVTIGCGDVEVQENEGGAGTTVSGGNGSSTPANDGAPPVNDAATPANDKLKLRRIGYAMHMFSETHRKFPIAKNPDYLDGTGQPLLNWRLHLLPYMNDNALFADDLNAIPNTDYDDVFAKLDPTKTVDEEPNKSALATATNPYVSGVDNSKMKWTRFRVITGEGSAFPNGNGVRIQDMSDGSANTIMAICVGADKAVEWTANGTGIPLDSPNLIEELGQPGPEGWLALFGDGEVRTIRSDIDAATLKPYLTIAGNERVDADDL